MSLGPEGEPCSGMPIARNLGCGNVKEMLMGYGFGGILVVVGLVLALAVTDSINGIDLTMVGWIMAAVGVVLIAITAVTLNGGRRSRNVQTTTHADGTQTVRENRTTNM